MASFKNTMINPPKIEIKENAEEIVFSLVSCMCDNISYMRLKKGENGTEINYYNGHCSLALSNLQMTGDYITNIKWAFENGDYKRLISVINSGTALIFEARSR